MFGSNAPITFLEVLKLLRTQLKKKKKSSGTHQELKTIHLFTLGYVYVSFGLLPAVVCRVLAAVSVFSLKHSLS